MKRKTIILLIVLIAIQLLEIFNDVNLLFYRLAMFLACLYYSLYLLKDYKKLNLLKTLFVVIPVILVLFRSILPFVQYFSDSLDNLPTWVTIYTISTISFIIPYSLLLLYFILIDKIYLKGSK
jgi:hypothetical protein